MSVEEFGSNRATVFEHHQSALHVWSFPGRLLIILATSRLNPGRQDERVALFDLNEGIIMTDNRTSIAKPGSAAADDRVHT
jgi:hypothetical protein